VSQEFAEWVFALLGLLLVGAGVTYGWMKFLDLLLWATKPRRPKAKSTTPPRANA
jgi:hypothetical protein